MVDSKAVERERQHKAMDEGFKQEAFDLLWDHYGKKSYKKNRGADFKKDCDLLWRSAQTEGQLFLMAVHRHVLDHTLAEEGRNAGDWMPSAANIAKHLRGALDERQIIAQKEKERGQENRRSVPLGDGTPAIVHLTDKYLLAAFGKPFIECIPNTAFECPTCGDTGYAVFYFYPEKRSHVFLAKEWVALAEKAPEKAKLFRSSSAICDECDYGRSIYERFRDNENRYRPANYWTIKRLAARRRERGKEINRQRDIAAGRQMEVELWKTFGLSLG